MSNIFNTDLGELYNSWGERVAYNEGFQKQKIDSARAAGRDAFSLGLDRSDGRDAYFASRAALVDDAAGFQVSDSAAGDDEELADTFDADAIVLADRLDRESERVASGAVDEDQEPYDSSSYWVSPGDAMSQAEVDDGLLDGSIVSSGEEPINSSGFFASDDPLGDDSGIDWSLEIVDWHSYNMANL